MDETRRERLRKVVFERLTLGASREAMFEELHTQLDADDALTILDGAVQEIAAGRARGDYDAAAAKTRKRFFKGPYLAWRILGSFLAIVGALTSVGQTLSTGTLSMAFGPMAAGLVILAIVDGKVKAKVQAAAESIDRLLNGDPEASASV